jgi:hypothetical protein
MLADVRHLVAEGPSTRHRRPWHDTLAHDHPCRNATLIPWPEEQENGVRLSAEVRLLAGRASGRGDPVSRERPGPENRAGPPVSDGCPLVPPHGQRRRHELYESRISGQADR